MLGLLAVGMFVLSAVVSWPLVQRDYVYIWHWWFP